MDQLNINQPDTNINQTTTKQSSWKPTTPSKVNIQPIGERVLITPIQQESKTSGGIFIPSAAKEQRNEGIVVAIGSTTTKEPLPLKINDHIIYTGFSKEEFTHNNQQYIMLDFKDVIAKVNK
jgi:chaperonin GroES